MNEDTITGYALLRDERNWEAQLTNLAVTVEGPLTLLPVPGPSGDSPVILPGPYEAAPSGIAIGDCYEVYLADTANDRVIWDDTLCKVRRIAPGRLAFGTAPATFSRPRGLLLVGKERLLVANSGHGQVQVLLPSTLEVRTHWDGLVEPTSLAADSQGRVYVADTGLKRVLRFFPNGKADNDYNNILAAAGLLDPAFLAVDTEDRLYVSDRAVNAVLRFAPDSSPLPALAAGDGRAPGAPRALAAYQRYLFVADASQGRIWLAECASGRYLGSLPAFQGPVTAMAADKDGNLYVKTDDAEAYLVLKTGQSYLKTGRLEAGPLDAGDRLGWRRLAVEGTSPQDTLIQLYTFGADDPDTPPAAADWQPAPSDDLLVPRLPDTGEPGEHLPRYLWVRVDLSSKNGAASPWLYQVQAETPGEDYLDYLPAIYARRDAEQQGFLQSWLALFRSELGDLELLLEDLPRLFDPQTTPAEHLGWLARWLAFDLPAGWSTDERRALFARMVRLYPRRDTLHGLREMIQIYSGVRPQIVESYTERRVWILGESSRLGFDTGLAPLSPDGIVVPDGGGATCDAGLPASEAWSEPAGVIIGEVVVGDRGPLAAADLGEPLFSPTAHHFTVLVPAARLPDPRDRQALVDLLEAEKPAHTDYHLCFIEPRMRVGFQARVGVDTIVAGPPEPFALDEPSAGLGFASSLEAGPQESQASRVGQQARLGRNLVIK